MSEIEDEMKTDTPVTPPLEPLDNWYTLKEVAEKIGVFAGKKVTPVRVWHWCHEGVRGVRLRHSQGGKTFLVRYPEAFQEFLKAIEEVNDSDPRFRPGRPPILLNRPVAPDKRAKQIAKAQENLRKMGI